VISGSVLANPAKIADLVAAVKKSVVLSAGWDLPEFAEQMRGLTGGNIEVHTIPTQGNAVIGGADVLRVDPAQVQAMVAQLTSDGTTSDQAPSTSATAVPGAEAVAVELFDGTGTAGLAAQTHTLLQNKGFKLGADQKLSVRASSVIRYNPADEAALTLVKQALGADVEAEPDRDVAVGHVRMLLGKDFRDASGSAGAPASSSAKPASGKTSVPPPTPAAPPITAGGVPCVN